VPVAESGYCGLFQTYCSPMSAGSRRTRQLSHIATHMFRSCWTHRAYGVDCRKQCHDSADASQHFAIFRSCQTLTLKPSTTVFDELTTTQPPPSSVRVCADRLPDPDSTTSSLPLSSKARPRGRASPVATTCHLYPDATEGLIFPEGESRHDD
jgi:hypothetical protein